MRKDSRRYISIMMAALAVVLLVGCASKKNTATTRWWKSFNSRYNTYYNGSVAYIDASLEKETGNKDNFTEMLPLYTVGNKNSRELGKANFERAIEKCQKTIKLHSIKRKPEWNKSRKKREKDIEWLNRKEYNPFLWKAWLLMGRSQFMKGSFEEAASTFAYMSRLYATQPAIYGKARAWLAKCYIEQDWLYDAEDVITKMRRDSLDWRARKEWDYTYADYYLRAGRYAEAIPYVRKVIRHEMRRKQRAREWFIMGQLYTAVGNKAEAYKAYKRVVRANPPYELEFNARIAMTEVMAAGKWKQMVGKLRRMAASDNNKEYLDQVYYAMGNIYMAEKDTLKAIASYEKGAAKSTRNGIEKGVLLLTLGDIYWAKEDYSNARRCYGEAIGLLDKDRKDYNQLSERSKILDELVPHTEAVHLQDSLQALAKMSEKDRNAAIDRVIEALKKKEKEERDAKAEAEAQSQQAQNGATGNRQTASNQTSSGNTSSNGLWYFYNQMTVNQGKTTFQRQWGKRDNVDDWQRVNKTVVASAQGVEEYTEEQRDSIARAIEVEDSIKNITDSAQNDPHKREYYLAQIPFTEEQVQASNLLIMDGLYNSGVIFKDKLDNLTLSEKALRRLTDDYTDYTGMDNAYYHLFLLYSRRGETDMAAIYLQKLKNDHPDSKWTTLLSDPYFKENAQFGVHLEDSLYAATYDAFKADRLGEVRRNVETSAQRFPMGANRDKFVFFSGMAKLNDGDATGCLEDMKQVVEKYPQSGVSPLAGMIINGVKAGRRLHGGKFDLSDVWERRVMVMNDSDSLQARKFEAERNVDFTFMVAYQPDSVNANQLLYELAKYNFSHFMVRNFEITTEEVDGLERMSVTGFKSYDEALQYARQLYANQQILQLTRKCRTIIISNKNLELLGTQYSYNDYDKFYEKHFIPLRISTVQLLTEPETIEYEKPKAEEKLPEDQLFNGGVVDDDTFLQLGVEDVPAENNTETIPAEEPAAAPVEEDNTVVAPAEEPVAAPVEEDNTVVVPVEEPAEEENTFTLPAEPETPVIEEPAVEVAPQSQPVTPQPQPEVKNPQIVAPQPQPKIEQPQPEVTQPAVTQPAAPKPATPQEPVIDFTDDLEGEDYNIQTPQTKPQNAQPEYDLEDEYYELDGF